MKKQKILRAVYLQVVSACLQMTPDNNSSLKGTGKIRYYDSHKIKYWQLPPAQSHIGHGWNDNQCSLIAFLRAVWCCMAFRKAEKHKKQGGREEDLLRRNVQCSHGWKLCVVTAFMQIGANLITFNISREKIYTWYFGKWEIQSTIRK